MDSASRAAYNGAFTPELYRRYVAQLERRLEGPIPFRVAETPLFLPAQLRQRLERHAREIVEKISSPHLIATMERAVPSDLDVPRRDALANCIQVDLAIVRDANGDLDGKLVELQGFPSLYAYTIQQTRVLDEILATIPGLEGRWTSMFGEGDDEACVRKLRRAIVGDCRPEEVILMDLDPATQKTSPDFVATRQLIGIDAVDPTSLERAGRTLFRTIGGRRVAVRRIFNRVVFDELLKKGIRLPFAYTDDLDVTWIPHPNWYWIWSKYTIPFIDHPAVPRATFLSELKVVPDDLENYVLKPLFSFAGAGVIVDVERADIDRIQPAERRGWLLQEKIAYAPALRAVDGGGVKAEVRMMFLRAPEDAKPELVINLARLSRGKMLGVDQNRDMDWIGGTVGIWRAGT